MDNLSFSVIIFLILILFFLYNILTNIKKVVDSIKFIFLLLIEATTFSKSDTLSDKTNKLLCWIILQVMIIIWYYKG
ncbi:MULTISPECIES: hypothetical protein [Fusobacterium]|mgnify:FL=1|uniref:Uncharacterized protein n=2 Tax=Fusobacterium animalis TaxID=76859 RepID=A0A2B7YXP4_9FUSO|nr:MULTISPECIES: hypothetical protein [Fusobacterium]AGM24435.1 hypothetical protein HMPREF0409_01815 [Fusobacterium animalis 4_8]MCG6844580.1 hypothetical protein [Fusobacterium nucleatum]PGH25930.1 hypothetical protein RN90_11600 [Fusobacterium animalis]